MFLLSELGIILLYFVAADIIGVGGHPALGIHGLSQPVHDVILIGSGTVQVIRILYHVIRRIIGEGPGQSQRCGDIRQPVDRVVAISILAAVLGRHLRHLAVQIHLVGRNILPGP